MINKFLSFFKKREIIRLNIYELIALDFYYGVSYIHTIAKGLVAEPEFVSSTENIAGANTTTNTVYLRIQRDF